MLIYTLLSPLSAIPWWPQPLTAVLFVAGVLSALVLGRKERTEEEGSPVPLVVYVQSLLYLVALWVTRHRSKHRLDEEKERTEEHEPRHSAPDEDYGIGNDETRDLAWLAEMHQPGALSEPDPGTDEWWEDRYDEFGQRMATLVRAFDAAFDAKVGTWAAEIRKAERTLRTYRYRVAAGMADTQEIPRQRELVEA